MWDYVPTRSYLAGDVDAWRASDLPTDGYDRVDPSPRDQQNNTCVNLVLSGRDRSAYLTPHGDARSVGSSSKGMPLDRDRTVHSPDVSSDGSEVSWKNSTIALRSNRDRGTIEPRSGSFRGRIASRQSDANRRTTKKTRGPLQSSGFSSNVGGTSWKNSMIAARSSSDRGAIEPRSRRFWRGIVGDSSPIDRQAIDEALASQLTHDRGPIVARSWRKSRRKSGSL